MTPEQFAYWLQGFFEMTETDVLSTKQVMMIREHLQLVFKKVTRGSPGSSSGGGLEKIHHAVTNISCSQFPSSDGLDIHPANIARYVRFPSLCAK